MIVPYANGWLLACTRSAWLDIGGFDLAFGKFDCGGFVTSRLLL